MTGLVLTRSNLGGGGGVSNTFETLVADTGSITALGVETLIVQGGTAIHTSVSGSPNTLTIDVNPSAINIGDLGNVTASTVADGYTLVYRTTSSSWVAEPSTTTDQFVKTSATDTTTAYLTDKLVAGTGITFTTLNPNADEQIEIALNAPQLLSGVIAVWTDSGEPTGIVDRTQSTISFNSTTRTLTIQPSANAPGSPKYFRYYIQGNEHDITTAKTATIPDATGLYYLYLDKNEVLQYQTTFDLNTIFRENAYVAVMYWNATAATGTQSLVYFGDERHGITMDADTHIHFHTAWGTRYIDGLALSNVIADSTVISDANVQFAVTNGTIRDEDLAHYIRDESTSPRQTYDLVQNLSSIAQIPVMFRSGTAWSLKPADNFPLIYSGDGVFVGGANGLPPVNVESGGIWSLTEVVDKHFFFVHYLATNDVNHPIVAIQGLVDYAHKPTGRDEASAELVQLEGLPFAEFTPIGSVICEAQKNYTNTPKIRYRLSDANEVYVDFRGGSGSGLVTSGGPYDHGSLGGLLDDDHPQYTLNAYDTISDGVTTLTASNRGNTIEFVGSTGIDVAISATGAPIVDTVTVTNTAPSPVGLAVTTINGQPMLTLVDTTRGLGSPPPGKILSVAEQVLIFSNNQLVAEDWLNIGNAADATTGFVADFNGTVVFSTGHCADTSTNSKDIHLYINSTDKGSIGTLTGGVDVSFSNETLDVDFVKGDKIQLRARQGTGTGIQDTVVKVTVKWRG